LFKGEIQRGRSWRSRKSLIAFKGWIPTIQPQIVKGLLSSGLAQAFTDSRRFPNSSESRGLL
jgi:hypothetical protein